MSEERKELPGMVLAGRCNCGGCDDEYSFELQFDAATRELIVAGVRMDLRLLLDAAQLDEATPTPAVRYLRVQRRGNVVASARWLGEAPDKLEAERDELAKQVAILMAPYATKGRA